MKQRDCSLVNVIVLDEPNQDIILPGTTVAHLQQLRSVTPFEVKLKDLRQLVVSNFIKLKVRP